jgi:hypothetical protein
MKFSNQNFLILSYYTGSTWENGTILIWEFPIWVSNFKNQYGNFWDWDRVFFQSHPCLPSSHSIGFRENLLSPILFVQMRCFSKLIYFCIFSNKLDLFETMCFTIMQYLKIIIKFVIFQLILPFIWPGPDDIIIYVILVIS